MLWGRTEESEAWKFILAVCVASRLLNRCLTPLPPPHSYLGGRSPREHLLETAHGKLSMVSSNFFQKNHYNVSHYTWCHQEPVWHREPSWESWESSSLPLLLYQQWVSTCSISKIKHFSLVSKLQGWLLNSLEWQLLNWDRSFFPLSFVLIQGHWPPGLRSPLVSLNDITRFSRELPAFLTVARYRFHFYCGLNGMVRWPAVNLAG